MKRLYLSGLMLTAMLGISGAAAWAQSGSDDVPQLEPNVEITIVLGESEKGVQVTREYKMLTRGGAGRADLLMGWRVPIPTARGTDESGETARTSFVYQNVGVTANLETVLLSDDRILLKGVVEASGSRKGPLVVENSLPPTVATFQQSINVIVRDGRPTRVAEVPDHASGTDGRLYLELSARVLR